MNPVNVDSIASRLIDREGVPKHDVAMLSLFLWRLLYRLVLFFAYPLVRIRLSWRSRREPAYGERIQERFGVVPASVPQAPVWFHTVSAGETIAAAPLIAKLAAEFPQLPFLVTTMTPTGSAQVDAKLGNTVAHCYAPYDFPGSVDEFFESVKPRLLVLMETELWPNLLRRARQQEIPALLVNARLSERSARGYGRIRALTQEMLSGLSFVACQYPDHAERFLTLGARHDRTGVLGSVKFDVELPVDHSERVAELKADWQLDSRRVWVAGSTHEGEESLLLNAHRLILERAENALLILVPRHPNRADEVAELLQREGFSFLRMSDPVAPPGDPVQVILGDTMGELLYLYGLSRVAFLGGSLVSVGGHNPIEAAVCGQPLLMGPETFNFPDVVAAFSDAGCLTLVSSADEVVEAVLECFDDSEKQRQRSQSSARVVRDNTGATERLLELLRAQIRAVC